MITATDDLPLRPVLKWPGGKRQALKYLRPLVPGDFRRYFEPFAGSAALFFDLKPDRAVLGDINSALIECYTVIRDNPDGLIRVLRGLRNSADHYYRIRSRVPADPVRRSARLIYLTSLSFNGIYRVNFLGRFNVPYGRRTTRNPCDRHAITAASAALGSARLECVDFDLAVRDASVGDFVYFDPPYTVTHNNNGFVRYNERLFSWGDQIRLSATAKRLDAAGAYVLVTNAVHPAVRALYPGFVERIISRPSLVAGDIKFRRTTEEAVFVGKSLAYALSLI